MYMLDVGIELTVMRTENTDTGAPVYCRLMSSCSHSLREPNAGHFGGLLHGQHFLNIKNDSQILIVGIC